MPSTTSCTSRMQTRLRHPEHLQTTAATTTVVTTSVTSLSPVPEQMGDVSPRLQVSPVPSTIPKQYPEPNLEEIFDRFEQYRPQRTVFVTPEYFLPPSEPMEGYRPTSGYPKTTRLGMVGLSNSRARPSFDPRQREGSQADMDIQASFCKTVTEFKFL